MATDALTAAIDADYSKTVSSAVLIAVPNAVPPARPGTFWEWGARSIGCEDDAS